MYIYSRYRYDFNIKWKPTSLSELTLIILYMELTHLGSEASKHGLHSIHHVYIDGICK